MEFIINYIMLGMLMLCFYGAARLKTTTKIKKSKMPTLFSNDLIKDSVMAQSIVELISIAGGIYVSVTLLVEFLLIPVPETITFLGMTLDPIAGVSVLLALIQPIVVGIKNAIFN